MIKKIKKNRNNIFTFLKTFLAALLIMLMVATPIAATVMDFFTRTPGGENTSVLAEAIDFETLIPADSPFFDAFMNTNRINILALGVERNNLTDTIMLVSFDIDKKFVDVISVPRDTYYYRGPGYQDKAHHKINAVYRGNPVNTAAAVSEILLNIPINYYVLLSYDGVAKIIDEIGGVPMDIPFHMIYDDPYDKPPLHINIPKGPQVLDGKKSVEFLRFRQANKDSGNRGYPDGDLGRIKAQQEFIKSAARQCLSRSLPKIIETAFNNIESDVSIKTALYLAGKAIGVDTENIRTYQIPVKGYDIRPDTQGIADMLTEIYSMEAVVMEEESS